MKDKYVDIIGEYVDNVGAAFGWDDNSKIIVTVAVADDDQDDSKRYNIDYTFLDSDNLVKYVKNSNTNKIALTTNSKN